MIKNKLSSKGHTSKLSSISKKEKEFIGIKKEKER
jgi:hypothetical protein